VSTGKTVKAKTAPNLTNGTKIKQARKTIKGYCNKGGKSKFNSIETKGRKLFE
jgi:hypothetical protein